MSDDREAESVARIEAVRRIYRKVAGKCADHGASGEELAIGALYAAFDLAESHAGPGVAAIEWLRTGSDVLERGLMDGHAQR